MGGGRANNHGRETMRARRALVRPVALTLTVVALSIAASWTLPAQERSTNAPSSRDTIIARSVVGQSEFTWRGRVARGKTIEVKGINGNVRASLADGDDIQVMTRKRARRSDTDEVEIQVLEHPSGITVCALYPEARSSRGQQWPSDGPNYCAPGDEGRMNTNNNDVHVDFEVRVPRGTSFAARTVNGWVRADSLDGPVDAYTINGDIDLSTTSDAAAATINGDVTATIRGVRWAQPLDFRTLNGVVTVEIPPQASARVRAEVHNGRIESDFPLEAHSRFGRRRMTGTIGDGRGELFLGAMNGRLRIRKGSGG